ncbi:c-type cytochrome [Sphingomonas sp. R-74633]|uniref:c-type cytochrome n=1 Tax=Sphingomonas sp. R-74633 TaxID=2751188 RepID=UPI0015D44E1F|nr:c-type cytochrome [Sphingomonas sp. R-74633]NYT43087.1 c-type cytochrome [Sphingomonas sp. R-74633]
MRITSAIALMALALLAGCSDDRHDERLRQAGPRPSLAALLKVADVGLGERKFGRCAGCHKNNPNAPDFGGPNLYGIYGRPMGQSSPTFGYTAALRNAGGKWDAATLDAWIDNPRAVVPGTSMQFAGVPDPLDRADIIAYLKSRSPTAETATPRPAKAR